MKRASANRHQARQLIVQALYQWEYNQTNYLTLRKNFAEKLKKSKVDNEYFEIVVLDILLKVQAIDNSFTPHLDRSLGELDPISRAICRLGTYELMHRLDIPYKVIINEALELAKLFGADASHKFINGVLDKVAQHERQAEYKTK